MNPEEADFTGLSGNATKLRAGEEAGISERRLMNYQWKELREHVVNQGDVIGGKDERDCG